MYVDVVNQWVADWTQKNPLNLGPNWKCGQESSIRMMQTLLAAHILGQDIRPTKGLRQLILEHCHRISRTIQYAISQDNNHGSSEAAALYIAGGWLLNVGDQNQVALGVPRKWHQSGLRWLENRVAKLVEPDGTFSQYSLNYQRVLVDTLCMVEFWRRKLRLRKFSDTFYVKAKAAVEWLYQMVDLKSGDGPNIGANDGSSFFALSSSPYRDFRPSVQLGSVLFYGEKAYGQGPWDETLFWLGLKDHRQCMNRLAKGSRVFQDGGYVTLHPVGEGQENSWAILRFPSFRFRPSHSDVMHFDLWHNGVNVLRDGGSYSYSNYPWHIYFSGVASHNTIQFEGRDQMPRLGRFLFGNWVQADDIGRIVEKNDSLSWTGAYTDCWGCFHRRTVTVRGPIWKIVDEVKGYKNRAILRWRLVRDDWKMIGSRCTGELAQLSIESSVPMYRCELVEGWESKYYMEKTEIPVLETEVQTSPATLITTIRLCE